MCYKVKQQQVVLFAHFHQARLPTAASQLDDHSIQYTARPNTNDMSANYAQAVRDDSAVITKIDALLECLSDAEPEDVSQPEEPMAASLDLDLVRRITFPASGSRRTQELLAIMKLFTSDAEYAKSVLSTISRSQWLQQDEALSEVLGVQAVREMLTEYVQYRV